MGVVASTLLAAGDPAESWIARFAARRSEELTGRAPDDVLFDSFV